MSLRNAIRFLGEIRADPSLRGALTGGAHEPTLAAVAQLAASRGCACSEDDLRLAFRYDWVMRATYFNLRTQPGAPSTLAPDDRVAR